MCRTVRSKFLPGSVITWVCASMLVKWLTPLLLSWVNVCWSQDSHGARLSFFCNAARMHMISYVSLSMRRYGSSQHNRMVENLTSYGNLDTRGLHDCYRSSCHIARLQVHGSFSNSPWSHQGNFASKEFSINHRQSERNHKRPGPKGGAHQDNFSKLGKYIWFLSNDHHSWEGCIRYWVFCVFSHKI